MAPGAKAQERLFALREQIARLEGKPLPALAAAQQAEAAIVPEGQEAKPLHSRLPFGIAPMDVALEGGLPLDGLTEIRSLLMGDTGAATGFALSLAAYLKAKDPSEAPLLWISDVFATQEAGIPNACGLRQLGLETKDVLYASPRKLEDALWIAETAVASGAISAIILEIRGNLKHFGLTESRRLSLRTKAAGRPLFILRHAGEEEASSALLRFLAEPAPASERRLGDGSVLGGSIGHPVFRLTLEKSRNPAPLSFLLEWNTRDRQFFLVRPTGEAFSYPNPAAHSGTGIPAFADGQDRPPAMGAVLAFERAS
jgi:protein ImuA